MASRIYSKRFLNRPMVVVKTSLYGSSFNSRDFSPFSYIKGFPIKGYKSCFSAIQNLLRPCSPTTILRSIITIVIDSIKRMFSRWGVSHIFKKASKIKPSFAYLNSSSSIIRIAFYTRIFTSANHAPPSTPFFSLFPIHSMTVFVHSMIFSFSHIAYDNTLTRKGGGFFG